MIRWMKMICFTGLTVAALAFIAPEKKIKVWLIGDSTVTNQPKDRSPVTGWGTPFSLFFDTTVVVDNRAVSGKSTRTFIAEGRWQAVYNNLQEGDYLFIQFGHNDEAKEPKFKDRYTPVPDYKVNLLKFISEAKSKGAKPVLVTPVTRMAFDADGNIKETHKEYSAAVWEVGKANNVPVIDLDARSRELLQEFGPKWSKVLYMHLDSLEHPFYPAGRKDNTHFSEYGARRMAELVLAEIRKLKLDICDRITQKTAP